MYSQVHPCQHSFAKLAWTNTDAWQVQFSCFHYSSAEPCDFPHVLMYVNVMITRS